MGVEIPIEHLEKTFKISGLKYRENYGFGGNFGFTPAQNAQNAFNFSPNSQNLTHLLSPNTKNGVSSKTNELKNALLNKAQNLHLSEFDRFFADFEEQNADFDFEKFKGIFENASSFENAEKSLIKAYKGEELKRAEDLLAELVANGVVLGEFLGADE